MEVVDRLLPQAATRLRVGGALVMEISPMLENLVREFYSIPPMAPVWETDPFNKALLDPGFVEWVDSVLDGRRAP